MPESEKLKEKIHAHCLQMLALSILEMQAYLSSIQAGMSAQGKSSAGDKHETAMAMANLEIEKSQRNLQHLLDMQSVFMKIDPKIKTDEIRLGSLIETDKGHFYVGAALGKISVDKHPLMALSFQSPLVQALRGIKPGKSIQLNGNTYTLHSFF